jgi:uncharacterized protein (TIGR01777 family)
MRVLVSGASGLVGSAIRVELEARGDEVGALVRGRASSGLDVAWDPAAGTIDTAALEAGRFDAVLHLAGETLIGRWTETKKTSIRASRVDGTTLIAGAIASLSQRPSAFLVASATGIYGDRGDELLPESAAAGTGFLADVAQAWEAAADAARDAGIRTVHLRMGPVQSRDGGALKTQLLPFKLGAGGRVGSGRQWVAWVGMHDTVRAWLHALDHDDVVGPVNVVGPTPATNAQYTKALGRAVHRPTILPAPVPIMKLALSGELVEEMLLASQKVVPARLEALGFEFADRTIDDALRRELGR